VRLPDEHGDPGICRGLVFADPQLPASELKFFRNGVRQSASADDPLHDLHRIAHDGLISQQDSHLRAPEGRLQPIA
jgi:hypothetical protein